MATLRAWTLHLSRQHITPREPGDTRHSLDPTIPRVPTTWWEGEGTLHFEGLDWSGAQMADGMLMDMGPVTTTPNLRDGVTRARLAMADEALRQLEATDQGTWHIEIGWIRNPRYGDPRYWSRIDRYHRGWMGQRSITGNVMEIDIEQYASQLDRRVVSYVSRTDYPQLADLAQGIVRQFPQFR